MNLRCCWRLGLLLAVAVAALSGRAPAAAVKPGDVAVVFAETADFGMRDQPMTPLSLGTALQVTEVRGSWVGGAREVDGRRQLGWIHRRAVQRVAGSDGSAGSAQQLAALVGQLLRAQVRVQLDGNGHVHALDAAGSKIVDSDLAVCEQFHHLVAADVSDTSVGDEGVTRMARAATLERVYLENTAVTGASLQPLANLKCLEVLVLAGTQIRGDDLARLAAVSTLRTLNLARCGLRDEDLRYLESLTNMEVLVVSDNAIAGAGLARLKPLQRLRVLNLSNTQITDPDFAHLEGAPSLRMLYIRGTQISADAQSKLDQTLTSCSMYQ